MLALLLMPSDCVGADMAARLLLVDDYRDALEMWAIYLRARGYDIDTASDGKTAVRLAIETRPDLIVMDLVLPGISGCEAARQLRARPETARIPIIATTGNTHPDELDRARRAGFVSIMIKPCDPPGLVGEIERILRTGADQASQAGARSTVH